MRDSKLYTNVLSETIEKIENSIKKSTKVNFMENLELQDATLMRLQVLGENIKKLPSEIKNKNKNIKWKKFEKLRNLISHKYDIIDYDIIWNFLQSNLGELKLAIDTIK
jgi:uncharacterized protein with HEPN domain